MLEQIFIRDFALIREARISLGPGLNLITGETGAGKSILLGALGLVLGSKATTDLIRSGAGRSTVEAVFNFAGSSQAPKIREFLGERGIDCEDDALILKREITTEGKGRSFLNAQQIPAGLLKELGRLLVEIHGQNEHQNILHLDTHRKILDRYAKLEDQVAEVSRLFHIRESLRQRLTSVSLDENEKNRRLELLRHEIAELQSAALRDERELEELSAEEKTLAHAEAIIADLGRVHAMLSEEGGILGLLSSAEKMTEMNGRLDAAIAKTADGMREAYFLLQEASSDLRSRAEQISADPERLSMVRERLDLLQKIHRKYGGSHQEAVSHLARIEQEYAGIEISGEEEEKLRREIAETEKNLTEKAMNLSKARRAAAADLEGRIQSELRDLGMGNSRIRISIKWEYGDNGLLPHPETPGKLYLIHSHGLDQIEFLIAASENETLRPLRKVASGGEMSRVMLAIKKIIIDSDPVGTLVFDEVDAGVGGRVAEAVGNKLASLSAAAQVIVITHLHQIAGMSPDNVRHFRVMKSAEDGTRIAQLGAVQRVEELARMIGGEVITETALNHARALLKT